MASDGFKSDFRTKVEMRTIMGVVDGKQLKFLAHVEKCDRDLCPLRDSCSHNSNGRCIVIYSFLKSLYLGWVDPKNGIGDLLTQIQLDRIGTHLMPLYHQLARFTLEASVLKTTTYRSKQGVWAAYPQFKEIRDVLTQIRAELKSLDLDSVWKEKFPGKEMPKVDIEGIKHKHGDPNYYDEILE